MTRISQMVLVLVLATLGPAASAQDLEKKRVEEGEKRSSRFATLDAHRIHFVDIGEGSDAVVFVHGWSCDQSFWRFQSPALAGKARVILLDLIGHGQSDKPKIAYTMDLFARSVDAVLAEAGVEKAVLVGHSNGAPVIRQFYRLFPKKTKALVVVDGTLKGWGRSEEEADAFLAPFRGEGYREAAEGFVNGMLLPSMDADVRSSIVEAMLKTPQHVMVGGLEAAFDPSIWKEDAIEVPLLVVQAKSPWWTEDYEGFVRGLAPTVEYHVFEGVSHFLMMDAPEKFNATLVAFLKKVGAVT